ASPRILHRDVKSTNILLDDKWGAKTDYLQSAPTSPARMQDNFGYFSPRAAPHLKDNKRVISELADPLLKDNYPEEEMQVMAYLAKECLLLDPNFRPSMSEVVQILSTISPDKPRRRSFPVNLFQNSLNRSMRSLVEIEKTDGLTENSTNSSMRAAIDEKNGELTEKSTVAEELKRTTSERWSPRCSLPLSLDRTLCLNDNNKDGEVALSADYMERLVLLTSKGRSWRAHPDDETVDLTEPRFESFLQANVLSV
ncbi:hypothetical protein MKX01_040398, partial [Papaver californicum]